MSDLYTLAVQYGTDKAGHGYCPHYERFFREYQERTCILLEMGIDRGSSLRMWRDWLPHARMIGLDTQDYGDRFKEEPWITVQGDQGVEADLERLVADHPVFDLIVDDAGHDPEKQRTAWTFLWPHLVQGGWYVIEDLTYLPDDQTTILYDLFQPITASRITRAQDRIGEVHLVGSLQSGDGLLLVRKR